jgi:hypothetical protein
VHLMHQAQLRHHPSAPGIQGCGQVSCSAVLIRASI